VVNVGITKSLERRCTEKAGEVGLIPVGITPECVIVVPSSGVAHAVEQALMEVYGIKYRGTPTKTERVNFDARPPKVTEFGVFWSSPASPDTVGLSGSSC